MSTIERSPEQIRVDARILERVKKGYALLQEKYGEDWVDHIDLRKLDLASGSCCILGQLYDNDYSKGEFALFESSDAQAPREHGFLSAGGISNEYDQLDEAWKAMIEQHFGREVEFITL